MRYIGILVLLNLFLLNTAPAQDEIPLDALREKAIAKFIDQNSKKEIRIEGDKTIDSGDIVDGNLVVEHGNLTIAGEVYGDVIVIIGNVTITNEGMVKGNVTAIDGKIYQAHDAIITGVQIETTAKNLFQPVEWREKWREKVEEYYESLQREELGHYGTLPLGKSRMSGMMRYNRIEGPFIGVEMPKQIGGKRTIFNLYGFGGYGFGQNAWQYKVGLNRWFFDQTRFRFELGGELFDYNDTKDDWIITSVENSMAAFFIHEDFQDFYRIKGYKLYSSLNLSLYLQAAIAYNDAAYYSLDNEVDWALFGGNKKFDENPAVEEGRLRSLSGRIYFDTRDSWTTPRSGWYLLLSGENSNSGLGSDFSFQQYKLDLRRYQKIGRYERLDFRVMAGTAQGRLPYQKSYELGGIGSIRGAGFRYFRSSRLDQNGVIIGFDRMLLANIEYTINHRIFHSGLSWLNGLNYLIIFDTGSAWHRDEFTNEDSWYKGFSHLKWNDMVSSFGIGLTSWSGRVRFTVSRRTDTAQDPLRFIFRFRKPF